MVIGLLASMALAHPGAFRVADHDLAITVTVDRVTLDYTLSVPRLHRHDGQPSSADRAAPDGTELLSGFRVLLDDDVVPLEIVEEPVRRTTDTADAIAVRLAGAAHLTGTHTIRVENGNFPDMPGLYRTAWFVEGGLVVHGGDRVVQAEGGAWTDRSAVWSPNEADRVGWLEVSATPHRGGPVVPAIDAVPHPTAPVSPWVVPLAIVGALLAIAGVIGWRTRTG